MSIEVLDTRATPLEPGRYYAWVRSATSRAARGYKIPTDTFMQYSFCRCSLPSPDHVFVKALTESSFQVMQDFVEVPDDGLYSAPGLQAKTDNMTSLQDLCAEQVLAERQFYEEHSHARSSAAPRTEPLPEPQREVGRHASEAKQNRNPINQPNTEAIIHKANAIAAAGHQAPQTSDLAAALNGGTDAAA